MENKPILRKVITGLSIVMIIYIIITIVSASLFMVLVEDHFSHGNGVGVFHASLSKYSPLYKRHPCLLNACFIAFITDFDFI